MDLIDRAALIASMGLENAVKWGNKDGYQQDHSYSTLIRYEIKDEIDAQPTIPAVPLDKLCEWLETNARLIRPDGSRWNLDWMKWKEELEKWMEGLDALN